MGVNNINKTLLKIAEKLTERFFKKLGGKLLYVKNYYVKTYSSPDKPILCPNFYIEFDNPHILGGGDYAQEVYPRYRKLRSDWRKFLVKSDMRIFKDFAPGFIPLLVSGKNKNGGSYQKEKLSLKRRIVPIKKIKLKYFQKLRTEFKVEFALIEDNGMLIGPEGGMLKAIDKICELSDKMRCFIDIGAGTGELSAYVIKKYGVKNTVINDASPYLSKHLKDYLGKISEKFNTEIDFQFVDCRKMIFPSRADLISIGVFYGIQPSLIKERGEEIAKILGDKGILIIQSSMPETIFNQCVLMGNEIRLNNWPWYSKDLTLPHYFSHYFTHYIDNEFITFASNSPKIIHKVRGFFDRY